MLYKTIAAEVVDKWFENVINTSAISAEKLSTIVILSSRRVLEVGAKIGSAVVSRNNNAVLSNSPDIIFFAF